MIDTLHFGAAIAAHPVQGALVAFGGGLLSSFSPCLYPMLVAAAMMADVIPVPVPAALQRFASTTGTGGRASGAFAMGAVSGLVAAPCGAPILAGILTWVTISHSATLGFVYLLAFSFGMCALLLLVALGADSALRLPRPGVWMVHVKRFFALILVGVAQYYLISMGQLIT